MLTIETLADIEEVKYEDLNDIDSEEETVCSPQKEERK